MESEFCKKCDLFKIFWKHLDLLLMTLDIDTEDWCHLSDELRSDYRLRCAKKTLESMIQGIDEILALEKEDENG